LGEEANFPAGMFRIAAQLRSKMMAYFVMKEKGLNYRVFVRELICPSGEESSAKIAETFARNYVKELEKIVKQYPEQ
jgi:lauroyl/myristoyl acyltransferase